MILSEIPGEHVLGYRGVDELVDESVVGDAFPQLGVALALLVAEAHRVLMLLETLYGVS